MNNNTLNKYRIKVSNNLIINNKIHTRISPFSKINLFSFTISYFGSIRYHFNKEKRLTRIFIQKPFLILPYINDNVLCVENYTLTWNTKKSEFVDIINQNNLPLVINSDSGDSIVNVDNIDIELMPLETAYLDPYSFNITIVKKNEQNKVQKNWRKILENELKGPYRSYYPIRDFFVRFIFNNEKLVKVEFLFDH